MSWVSFSFLLRISFLFNLMEPLVGCSFSWMNQKGGEMEWRNYGLKEQFLWPVSIFTGIIMCRLVYELTRQLSSVNFKGYNRLTKSQKIEWNNRGFSTFHALVAAAVSFYLLVVSDLFKDGTQEMSYIHRFSWLSDSMFGISLGYFLSDLAMILYYFPSLGGTEYILHHALSMHSIFLSLISGQAQMYILVVLFSEATTPFVNLRWYLDLAGKKNSNVYIYNGVALFLCWLVARILLFVYFFVHIYLHFDQVKTMFPLGMYTLLTVPPLLAAMNLLWFWKIFKGMMKALSRKKQYNH